MSDAAGAIVPGHRPRPHQVAGFALLLTAVSWALGAFAAWPWTASDPGAAMVRVSVKHVTRLTRAAGALSPEELAKLPVHMRPPDATRAATGRRTDATLTVQVDGRTVLTRTYRPTGLRHDGPTYGYEEIPLPPGRHRLTVRLADTGGAAGEDRSLTREIELAPGQAPLVEHVAGAGWQHN